MGIKIHDYQMASTPSSSGSPPGNTVQPYRMHVSQKYLDLTKQKLELTRLPREPRNAQYHANAGVQKSELEPLIDHWMESYNWRAQETFYNDTLPQFRVAINGTRLHFVHKRSNSPTALPLLFIHGWPESFIAVSKMIDPLTNPIATPPRGDENVQAFHVVAPSIPGFGFSDPIPEAANNMQATAEVFNTLMAGLGYSQYICHGTGWGFKICRILALTHPESCIGIHTANPEVPSPRSTFGYSPEQLIAGGGMSDQMQMTPHSTPPQSPGTAPLPSERPQTMAYALCDSPTGLLAHVVDSIQPQSVLFPTPSPSRSPENARYHTVGRSPTTPQSHGTPQKEPSPGSATSSGTPQNTELSGISSPWTPTALVNWAMLYWLPGPEVALRWLVNSSKLVQPLWTGYSGVPLGISYFKEPVMPGAAGFQSPPQWAEAYHRIAMVRRRDGRVRFPAWERPAEVVMDIREFADLLGSATSSFVPVSMGF